MDGTHAMTRGDRKDPLGVDGMGRCSMCEWGTLMSYVFCMVLLFPLHLCFVFHFISDYQYLFFSMVV